MAESSTPLELIEAYRLIKAGQRQEAGGVLKAYLAQNGRDARAWWLMAHAVDKPENVRRCLETVLKLDPNHTKAREKLDRLAEPAPAAPPVESSPAPSPAPAPAVPAVPPPVLDSAAVVPPPQVADEEPDDSFFGVSSTAPVGRSSRPLPVGRSSQPIPPGRASKPVTAPPASSEPVGRSSKPLPSASPEPVGRRSKPLPSASPEPVGRRSKPLASLAPAAAPLPSFEEYAANSSRFDDPFATRSLDDPFADIPAQPDLGGVLPKPPKPTGAAWGEDFATSPSRHGLERAIGFVVVAFALIVALGLILVVADRQGLIHLGGGDKVPKMVVLDGGTFQIDYPTGWDMRCLQDVSGYPVCGMANHPMYNEVDYFAGTVNLGSYISESMGSLLTGQDLPDQQVSIIVMDVPRSSPSYDDASLAKSLYEWDQEWTFSWDKAKSEYDHQEITVDGLKAYYYEYTRQGNMKEAAWDVYVEHDGIILWLRVSFFGPRRTDIPANMVEKMIQSIHFKTGVPM